MNPKELLHRYLDECPLIAIIRGVTPEEAEAIGDAVQEGGIRIIEVPLNSPDALKSIELLAKKFGDSMLVGAGTVLAARQVQDVKDAGGRIIVSPDTNTEVIATSADAGLVSSPGYFTPSEAFAAIRAGAHAGQLRPSTSRIGTSSNVPGSKRRALMPMRSYGGSVSGVQCVAIPQWRQRFIASVAGLESART